MQISSLVVKIGANITELQTGLSKASKSIENVGRKMTDMGKTMSMRVTAPVVAGFGFAVKAASDAEETVSKFATVFRDVGDEAEKSFGILRNQYGLSSTAAKQLLGDTGDLLTGFGFTQTEALGLSEEVNKLAVDLASFTNFSGGAAGASAALTKALLGERESVKSLGISILEEDVKKQMAINSSKGMTFATERQAKAQATLDLAIQQSQNAIGDYARTSDSFANQTRLLQARLSDLAVEMGTILLPNATKMLTKVQDLISRFRGLDAVSKEQILVFGGIAAAIGPVLLGLGKIITTVKALTAAMIANPFTAIAVAVLAIGTHAFMVNRRLSRMNDLVQEALDMAPTGTQVAIDKLNQAIVFQESLISQVISQHKTMGVVGSESSERQLAPMREILNELIGIRNESAGLQLQGIIDGKEIEKAENLSVAVSGLRYEIERFKDAIKPEDNVFDLAEDIELRQVRQEFDEFNNSLYNFVNTDWSTPIVKLGEETEKLTNSFATFAGLAVQTFDRLIFSGQKFGSILASIVRQLASKALMAALPLLLPGGGGFKAIGGIGGFLKSIFVNDALITSGGDVVKFHPNDSILAMKDFSNLNTGGSQRVEVYGTIKGQDLFISSQRGSTSFNR